jgi:hypothetical protein
MQMSARVHCMTPLPALQLSRVVLIRREMPKRTYCFASASAPRRAYSPAPALPEICRWPRAPWGRPQMV